MHFTTQLGYNSIILKSDNQNSAKALKDKVQKVRSSLGLATTLQENIPYDHESNGAAERVMQTVRRQANTLLDELLERTQLSIPHEHAVVSWAFRHACWLLNRFAVSSATKRTPQEVIHGYPYTLRYCGDGKKAEDKEERRQDLEHRNLLRKDRAGYIHTTRRHPHHT